MFTQKKIFSRTVVSCRKFCKVGGRVCKSLYDNLERLEFSQCTLSSSFTENAALLASPTLTNTDLEPLDNKQKILLQFSKIDDEFFQGKRAWFIQILILLTNKRQ